MDRSCLKTIVIVILALMNAFLALFLFTRHSAARSASARTAQSLSSLYAKEGIALSADTIPAAGAPAGGTASRSLSEDKAVAEFLLTDVTQTHNEGGGIYLYTGSGGQATFRSGGSFDASGALTGAGGEAFCRKFCKTFRYQDLTFSLDAEGSGSATAVQSFNAQPVINARVTFTLEQGRLTGVSGIHLPDAFATVSADGSMTAATALTHFLSARKTSGVVVSSVTEITPCYQLQSTTAAAMVLCPIWRITTDAGVYDVSCDSGIVTRS